VRNIIFALCLFASLSIASESSSHWMQEIVTEMKRVEAIAESVKMNEPYQPYIVTVFLGKDLERIGVSNLQEALELVPGVDIATDNMDNKRAVFRGSNPYAYGQSKLFVDGVEVNDLFFDSYGSFLSMPIEMIKRIEVTRGPGSISDGYNAYAGSIHIITYGERTIDNGLSSGRIIAKAGSYNYRMGGFTKAYQVGDLSIFTDFFYQRDDKHLPAGPDALATGIFGPDNISLAKEGEAPLWMRNYTLGLQFDYKALTFRFRTTYNERGSAYGINGSLPNEDDHAKFPVSYAELSYHPKIGECQTFIKVGIKESAFKSSAMLLPSEFQLDGVLFSNGFYGEHIAKLRKVYQTSYAKYTGIEHHTLNIGYYIDYTETDDVVTKTTDRVTGVDITDYAKSYPFTDPNACQHTYRLFLQDRYHYNKALSFQFGVNIERVSNI